MDPVTITATVITFATAIKDLVELGQKIHESFAKVSKNRRSAQRAAENVKDMIDEIVAFCEEHKDTIADMKEFTVALDALLKKLRLFETSILPLVPQRGGSWILVSFLRKWWNNNKVKDSILDLEGEIREVRRRYVMKSAMRTEVNQQANHQDTTRRLEGLSQGLELVRTDVHAMRVSTTVAPIAPTTLGTTDERERNVILFVRSAMSKSTSLLRPPDEVTEDVWMTVFIKSQVPVIEAEVTKISTLRVFAQSDAEPFGVTPVTDASMAISCLRRDVVRKLMDLRDVLSDSEGLRAVAVDDAAIQLNHISVQLSALGLKEESELFLDWTIKLGRALVNVPGLRGEAQHRARLALYLHRLSLVCGDMTQTQQAIEESLSIAEDLLSHDHTDTEIQGLDATILLEYAEYAPDNESAINRCIQAIQLLEGIFDVETLVRVDSNGATGAVMNPSYDLVDHVFSLLLSPVMIYRCADAFMRLAVYILRASKSNSAKRLAHLCIALQRQMVLVYDNAHQPWLAGSLSFICCGKLAQCFTNIELLEMVDECALLFRQCTENNPEYYSQHLLRILWKRADILDQLNRYSDSVSTREEVVSLAGQIMQDFKLQAEALFRLAQGLCNAHMYLDAARTLARIPAMFHNELHGSCYAYLSRDLLRTQHYKESAEAASTSIAIYRKLRPDGPAQETSRTRGLISALSALVQAQIALGDHTRGFSSLHESVVIASNTLNATSDELPDSLGVCLNAFEMHVRVSSLHDKEFTIDLDSMPIQTLQHLASRHPQNKAVFATLADAQIYFAYHLYRLGRLQDALAYADQLLDAWTSREDPAHNDERYAVRLKQIKARTLDAQGYSLDARLVIQNLRLTVGHNYSTLLAHVYEVQLSVDLGDRETGLEVAEEALVQSRYALHYSQPILSLFGVAYAALHSQNYQHTMEAAGEGIELSADPDWVEDEDEDDISIRPSLFAIMSSAQANTGDLDRATLYAQQAVTLSLDIAERKHNISATTAKHSLMETRGYLAEVLLATGEVTRAREICHERKVYFTERVENKDGDPRLGEYRDLAPILRMLGVLCCSEGRHDEGEAAAQELTEIMRRLGLTFPSLQEQVKIRLRYQASVPILQVLDEMTEKLSCEHQKGIKALFEV